MARIVFSLVFAALILIFCNMGESRAQASSAVGTVSGVKVDVADESSVKARDKAFAQAQVEAFKMLAQKYGEPNHPVPDSKTLSRWVKDFEVTSEQFSSKRYRGTYTIRFYDSSVISYFGRYPDQTASPVDPSAASGAPVSASASVAADQYLVIPFQAIGETNVLWDKPRNEFWKALDGVKLPQGGLLPQGTVLDATDIWEKNPNLLSMTSVRKIIARYKVDSVVIVSLRGTKDGKTMHWYLDLYRTDRGRVELARTTPVPLTRTVSTDTIFTNAAREAAGVLGGDWKTSSYQGYQPAPSPSEAAAPQTQTADAETLQPSGSSAPALTSPQSTAQTSPSATVPASAYNPAASPQPAVAAPTTRDVRVLVQFSGLQQWLSIQKQLRGSSYVKALRMTSLRTSEADIVVETPDWAALTGELGSQGYVIQSGIDGVYRIHR